MSVREDSGFIRFVHGVPARCETVRVSSTAPTKGRKTSGCAWSWTTRATTAAVLVNKEASLSILGMSIDEMRTHVDEHGDTGFVQRIRETMLGRRITVSGRSIVDEQGAMVLADDVEVMEHDAQMRASELRTQWGWA